MQRGFSLVELSIVLVILGLLTGGILAGQSLIRAAELRSVSVEYSRYVTAVQSFRDKYFAVPGDMMNATSFWGDNNSLCPDAAITNGTPGTCNGNGTGSLPWGSANGGEKHRFWQHITLAGLIEGNYPGTSTSPTTVIGTDAPRSRLSNAGWGIGGEGNNAGTGLAWGANAGTGAVTNYGNFLVFGAQITNNNPLSPVLKPDEAWNIDTKIDDGKPGRGNVISYGTVGLCALNATNTDYDAAYALNSNELACAFYFRNAF